VGRQPVSVAWVPTHEPSTWLKAIIRIDFAARHRLRRQFPPAFSSNKKAGLFCMERPSFRSTIHGHAGMTAVDTNHSTSAGRWLRIFVFYIIAIGFSIAARLYWHANDATAGWPTPSAIFRHLLSGIGPFIGAFVVWTAFRHPRRITFCGTSPTLAWTMLAVPAATIATLGVPNPYGIAPHLFGLFLGAWIAVYAILEETGWRGYLQDELCDHPPLRKYAIVGLFWYPWHLTFLQHHTITNELAIFTLIILASIGIGFVADRTKSIFAASAFHAAGNILGLTAYFTIFIPSSQTRLAIAGICIAVWIVLLRIWRKRTLSNRQVAAGPVLT